MKKIISLILALVLLSANLGNALANASSAEEFGSTYQYLSEKDKDLVNKAGKYIDEKLNTISKLNSAKDRIASKQEKIESKIDSLYEKKNDLISSTSDYGCATLECSKIEDSIEKLERMSDILLAILSKINSALLDPELIDLSKYEDEINEIEALSLAFQKNLYNGAVDMMEDLTKSLEKDLHKKEKVNASFAFELPKEKRSVSFDLKDLESTTHNLDSQTNGNLSVEFEDGEENGKASADFSVIVSDLQYFLKTNNLTYSTNVAESESMLSRLKANFNKNEYTKIIFPEKDERELREIRRILNMMSSKALANHFEKIKSEPFFTLKEVQGSRMYIRPSREFCSFVLTTQNVFEKSDFTLRKCSDIEYKYFMSEFHDLGIYVEKEGNSYLIKTEENELNAKLDKFGDLKSLDLLVEGGDTTLSLVYNGEKAILNLDNDDLSLETSYVFSGNKSGDFVFNMSEDSYREATDLKFSIINKEIKGELKSTSSRYIDWSDRSKGTEIYSTFTATADGFITYDGKLGELNINSKLDSDTLKADYDLNYKKGEHLKSKFTSGENTLLDMNVTRDTRGMYNGYLKGEVPGLSKIDYIIKENKINGTIDIMKNKIISTGEIKDGHFSLNNSFIGKKMDYATKKEIELLADANFEINFEDHRNFDFKMLVDAKEDSDRVYYLDFKFDLETDFLSPSKINAPSNYSEYKLEDLVK